MEDHDVVIANVNWRGPLTDRPFPRGQGGARKIRHQSQDDKCQGRIEAAVQQPCRCGTHVQSHAPWHGQAQMKYAENVQIYHRR